MRGRSGSKCMVYDFEDMLKKFSRNLMKDRDLKAICQKYANPHDEMEVDVLGFMDDLKQFIG